MLLTRRESVVAAVAALPVACGRTVASGAGLTGSRTPVGAKPLHLRPPKLDKPTVIDLDDQSDTYLKLYGEGRDWIIRLPRDRPLASGLTLDGRNEARNIVVLGGAIEPAPVSDLKTTRQIQGGSYSVYAVRGFSGATGGTFRIQTSESGPYTAPVEWNATPADIALAIEAVLGSGSVRAVAGPDVPGGPWRFVPSDNRMGRVSLDLTELRGDVQALGGENFFGPASGGLSLKDFHGTVHLEGVAIGGPNCYEGIDVQTPYSTAGVQLASCHISVPFFYYNNDWQHPDAMQCYLGPPSLQIERTDLITYGTQSLLGQPRQTGKPAPLELLRDWWFQDVLFQARFNQDHPTHTPGSCCYMEDNWPRPNDNEANWHWDMKNCYASRLDAQGREVQDGVYLLWWNHYPLPPPAGLHLKRSPATGTFASPADRLSGVGYHSPGYTGKGVPLGTPRLHRNTKLT